MIFSGLLLAFYFLNHYCLAKSLHAEHKFAVTDLLLNTLYVLKTVKQSILFLSIILQAIS